MDALVKSDQPPTAVARRVIKITQQLADKVAPLSACGNGCSYCCHQSVGITTWEAAQIGYYIKRTPAPAVDADWRDGGAAFRERYARQACPFLKAGRCSIYAVRPHACRITYSMADDPTLCDMFKHRDGIRPLLQFPEPAGTVHEAEHQGRLGLRGHPRFFPAGLTRSTA